MRFVLFISCATALFGALSCGDRGVKDHDETTMISSAKEKEEPVKAPVLSDEAPGGEMILGLAVPGLAGQKRANDSSAKEEAPPGREELRATFDEALAENRIDDAIATADVLSLMYPGDAEILEMRGRALLRRGDAEAGANDLARCCEIGRSTCCEASSH